MIFGPVAQLGERTVRIRKVVGSNPFRSTIKSREIKRFHGFCNLLKLWCELISTQFYHRLVRILKNYTAFERPECHRTLRPFAFLQEDFKMNDQTNMAQLRYLEELKIRLVHADFEPERIEDQHLPVRWERSLPLPSFRKKQCAVPAGERGWHRRAGRFAERHPYRCHDRGIHDGDGARTEAPSHRAGG